MQVYYPSYSQLTVAQRAAYLFIRQEFWNGFAVEDVPLSYLFLCAYEIGSRAGSIKSLEEHFTSLRALYALEKKFNRYLAHWIVEARIATKKYVWDEIARYATADRSFWITSLDMQLLAGVQPETSTVLALPRYQNLCPMRREHFVRALDLVRSSYVTDPILEASLQGPPADRKALLFSGYPHGVSRLLNSSELSISVGTFTNDDSTVMQCVASLIKEAAVLIGEQIDFADNELDFTRVAGTEHTVPIVRRSTTSPRRICIEAVETLEDFERAIESFWTVGMCLMVGLILWLSDSKPYIEGLIAFSPDLRRKYERLSTALNVQVGIAPFRQAFYYLGQGTLAPWSLNVNAGSPLDLRVGKANARFTKALQREMRGSAARARIFLHLTKKIASDRGIPCAQIANLFAEATGVPQPQGF